MARAIQRQCTEGVVSHVERKLIHVFPRIHSSESNMSIFRKIMQMQRLIVLQGDSSCPHYFIIAVTFTSQLIKPLCLSPTISPCLPALYSHDTSSSSVVCLSPQLPLIPDSHRSVIYMQILLCDCFKKKKRGNCFPSYRQINTACNLPGFQLSISDSTHLIGHGLQKEQPAVSNPRLKADGGTGGTEGES